MGQWHRDRRGSYSTLSTPWVHQTQSFLGSKCRSSLVTSNLGLGGCDIGYSFRRGLCPGFRCSTLSLGLLEEFLYRQIPLYGKLWKINKWNIFPGAESPADRPHLSQPGGQLGFHGPTLVSACEPGIRNRSESELFFWSYRYFRNRDTLHTKIV